MRLIHGFSIALGVSLLLAVPVVSNAKTVDVGSIAEIVADPDATGSPINVPTPLLTKAPEAFKLLILSPPTFRYPGVTDERFEQLKRAENKTFDLSDGIVGPVEVATVRQYLKEGWRVSFGSGLRLTDTFALIDPARGVPKGAVYLQTEVEDAETANPRLLGHMIAWAPAELAAYAGQHLVNGVPVMVVVYEGNLEDGNRRQLFNSWQSPEKFSELCNRTGFAGCQAYLAAGK